MEIPSGMEKLRKIDIFGVSKLGEMEQVVVYYQPKEGNYSGRSFLIQHGVPCDNHAQQGEGISGKALYSRIFEIIEEGKVEEIKASDEFEEIFIEAIEEDKGGVFLTPYRSVVKTIEELVDIIKGAEARS